MEQKRHFHKTFPESNVAIANGDCHECSTNSAQNQERIININLQFKNSVSNEITDEESALKVYKISKARHLNINDLMQTKFCKK